MAKLYFRYGAMNCGKSTALMQVAHNYKERGMNSIILKPELDSKGGGRVVSRLGIDRQVDVLVNQDKNLFIEISKWVEENGKLDCVLVDEVQFLTKEHIDQLFKVAVLQGIPVICYGLRTDFQLKGFEGSQRLLLLAHSIEELKTVCRCGKKAVQNARKVNGEFVREGSQIAIDGEDKVEYESLCAKCYFELVGDIL